MSLAIKEKKEEILNKMLQAMRDQNVDSFKDAMVELSENVESQVLQKAAELAQVSDREILASRGVRQLTSVESKFFEALATAMRSDNPKQAITNIDVVMPETEINAIFEDLQTNHELLAELDIQNTQGLIKYLINKNPAQKATWGKLTDKIKEEMSSSFEELDMSLLKLSAFIPVSKAMLDLGPVWLESYIRTVLSECMACGLEDAVVNNLKSDSGCLGMMIDFSKAGTVASGVTTYTAQTAIKVTDLEPTTYGSVLAKLALSENDKPRTVNNVIMIVNPNDYFNKVFPATTVRGADGTYRNDVLPYPTKVIQSIAVPEGKAIVGMGKYYFLGIGMDSKDGAIKYDDSCQFLDDNRVYLSKLYANGKPKDKHSFVVLDITKLKPATIHVTQVTDTAATA